MSKPVRKVRLITAGEKRVATEALIDSGSFRTLIRADILPKGTPIMPFAGPKQFRTAGRGGRIRVQGITYLVIFLEGKMIDAHALVSKDLHREMLIGADAMQMWDIDSRNRNGSTRVVVGRDMRDPEITEVD